ncbi:hypothetical protein HK104_003777 [Borealophlyctis nickersoniae]|nr:hypothetical protein HK104_003777 [Borealophlyctis nickersoniae]
MDMVPATPPVMCARPQKTSNATHSCLVNASCTLVGEKVYVFGGFHLYTDEVYNDLYVLNRQEATWKRVEHIKGNWPCQRSGHTTTLWKDNLLVIFGGTDMNDKFLNDVHILNLQTLMWEQPEMQGTLPAARAKHSAVIHRDKLYIVGGCEKREGDVLNSLNILDLTTMTWAPPVAFIARYSHFSCVYRDRLYVYGGLNSTMDRTSDIAFVDLEDLQVSQLVVTSDESPTALGQHFSQLCGNRLVVVVACLKQDVDTIPTGIWSLELDSLRWRRHDDGQHLNTVSWHYYAMNPDDRHFLLLGADENGEDDSHLSVVLSIDLEAYGIVCVPPPSMGLEFGPLLERGDLSDFTIVSSKEPDAPPIKVHRLVLCARWPHFRNMSASGMSEATSGTLRLDDSYESIKEFVRFLYTDSVEGVGMDELADLLVMSNRYCLDRLYKLCCDGLHQGLGVENVARVFARACVAQEMGLKARAFAMILERFGAVVGTKGFRDLNGEQLVEIWNQVPAEAKLWWAE